MKIRTLGLVLIICAAHAATAATNIGLKGIGPRAGLVWPEAGDGTFTIGLTADMGTWTDNLPWEMALTYWGNGEEGRYAGTTYDWSYTNIAYRNTVAYLFEIQKNMYVYPGAGLSVNFFNVSWDGPYEADHSDTELTLTVLGGFQFPIAEKWHGQAEMQFDIGDPDQTALQVDFIYELGK
ncbi:MAG: outer membrane beta-barrel protein [bacterium]|nr:outer membrane beta-barrel protein [bacterium]